MRLGKLRVDSNADTDALTNEPPHDVREKRLKNTTRFTTSCDVEGVVSFVRAPKSARGLRLVRWLRLIPPVPFNNGALVYGLSDAMVSRLRADEELARAVGELLELNAPVSLQKRDLTCVVFNKRAGESKGVLTFNLRAVARRLEKLADGPLNAELGNARLTKPYLFLMAVPSFVFGLCLALPEPTLRPLLLGTYGLMLSFLLAGAMLLYLIPTSLRKHALGGAIASIAVTSALISSFVIGPSIAIIGNTVIGERILPAQRFRLTGAVHIKRGKNMSCWLRLDAPSTTIAPGMAVGTLPLTCGEAHYKEDPMSRPYDVDVNPGLLGAPFVQSIHAVNTSTSNQS